MHIEHLVKKNLKNSYISINKNAQITLKTPKVSDAFVYELLYKKELWIRKKLHEIKQHPALEINLEDEVLIFGEIYSIDSPEAYNLRIKLEKIKVASKKNIIKSYNMFYREYANSYIAPRVLYFSQMMNLSFNEIKFRKMKSRWGSCNSKRVLTFNTELIKTKKELIDYVVVHELAHLTHMNHSKKFHALVEKYLPDSKKYSKELKKVKLSSFEL